jgi:hypothetical protein
MKDFLTQVLGGQSVPQFAVAIFFALLGIVLRLLYHATQRNQASPRTPIEFQFLFLIKDNALRLFSSNALSLLLVLITLRFANEILHVDLNPFVALIIGFGSDTLAEKFKEASRQIMPYDTTLVTAAPAPAPSAATPSVPKMPNPPPPPAKVIDPAQPAIEQIQAAPVVEMKMTEQVEPAAASPVNEQKDADAQIQQP